MAIRFSSVIGADVSLLDPAIKHYRQLGVEHFHIARHVESTDDPEYERSREILARSGLSFSSVHQGPWDEDLNAYLIRAQMRRHPDDWWVVADLDEFQVYDRPLAEVITSCEKEGCDYVVGALLDRVAADGSLAALQPDESVWEQYPLAGLITLNIPKAGTSKVTLARGSVHLRTGQHRVLEGNPMPAELVFPQVHHFKWTDTVLPRLTRRVEAYGSGEWHLTYSDTVDESRRILRHLKANQGHIDVAAPELLMRQCGSDYMDYQPWPELLPMLKGRR